MSMLHIIRSWFGTKKTMDYFPIPGLKIVDNDFVEIDFNELKNSESPDAQKSTVSVPVEDSTVTSHTDGIDDVIFTNKERETLLMIRQLNVVIETEMMLETERTMQYTDEDEELYNSLPSSDENEEDDEDDEDDEEDEDTLSFDITTMPIDIDLTSKEIEEFENFLNAPLIINE